MLPTRDRILGCFLGGAVGDALGADIEFLDLGAIRSRFGPDGLTEYAHDTGRITDDTQMTLFTAEGLLRAHNRWVLKGIAHPPSMIHAAYLRWLTTQQRVKAPKKGDGWLMTQPQLFVKRAPGATCMGALQTGRMGTPEEPLNDSKGCGGVMRVAPCGLMPHIDAFNLGVSSAAITHGHPTSSLSSGAFALIIRLLFDGATLPDAITVALDRARDEPRHDETVNTIERAVELAASKPSPTPEDVERLGGGWIAEEALGISLYCALTATSFEDAIRIAVNHSGDSDSTGAITGNLLGVQLGVDVIPSRWLDHLAERELVETVATDFHDHFFGDKQPTIDDSPDFDRYPGS